MKYKWMDAHFLAKKGAVKDFKEEWSATRYLIGGKMFALQGENKEKNPIITLKCDPAFGHHLREQYEDISAGYYMNKVHWNSVRLDGQVPDDVLKEMIDMSYDLIFRSLSKKTQRDIIDQT